MIVLHGMYDNGKVILTEKNPPQLKAEVEIRIHSDAKNFSFSASREILASCTDSLSDAVIAERREND